MDIGDRIKILRKHRKMTQKQLAEKLGVAEITIRQYESNKRQPNMGQIYKIADSLEVLINALLHDYEMNLCIGKSDDANSQPRKRNNDEDIPLSDIELRAALIAHYDKKLADRVPEDAELTPDLLVKFAMEDLFDEFKEGNVSLDSFLKLIPIMDKDLKEFLEGENDGEPDE